MLSWACGPAPKEIHLAILYNFLKIEGVTLTFSLFFDQAQTDVYNPLFNLTQPVPDGFTTRTHEGS